MDTQTIDQEFEKLQTEFQDVAKTVQGLASKMQAAEKAGDTNATEWLADLKQVAQDVDDEQTQVKALLLAVHGFIGGIALSAEHPPLYAPGHEPESGDDAQQQPQPQHHGVLGGVLGGMLGGGMMGGGMFGGYYGGGFGQAMEMGMAMNLGASLVNSIFR